MLPRNEQASHRINPGSENAEEATEFTWPAKPRKKLTGLQNQGGTCYLNTLLQTLLHTPEFTYRLFKLARTVKKEKLKRMIQEMLNLFHALITNDGGAISSKPLTDSFGWTGDEVCVHQDIQELNRLLFEQIEIALKGTNETNLISDLFRGIQCTRIRCLKCGRTSERNDEFHDINLSVMEYDSVEASLTAHTQIERLTGDNQYFCESCQGKVDAVKMTRFEELPPILTLSLSRFYFDSKTMQSVKLEKMCSFPLILDMNSFFMDKPNQKTKYDLFSVVLHVGGSTGGGHYHAFIKDPYGTMRESHTQSASASEFNANNRCQESLYLTQVTPSGSTPDNYVRDSRSGSNNQQKHVPFAYGEQLQMNPCRQSSLTASGGTAKKAGGSDPGVHTLRRISSGTGKSSSETDNDTLYMPKISDTVNGHCTASRLKNRLISRKKSGLFPEMPNFQPTAVCSAHQSLSSPQNQASWSRNKSISNLVGQSQQIVSAENSNKPHSNPSRNVTHERNRNPAPNQLAKTKRLQSVGNSRIMPPKRSGGRQNATDAISIYATKRQNHISSTHFRSLSASAATNLKSLAVETTETRKVVDELAGKMSSLNSRPNRNRGLLARRPNNRRNQHSGSVNRTSDGLSSLQFSQHNSLPRKRISSISSVSSKPRSQRSQGPNVYESYVNLHSFPQHESAKSAWHSRLFEGSANTERYKGHNSEHRQAFVNDPVTNRGQQVARVMEPCRYPNDPPPAYDSLEAIPRIHRLNAQLPSWRTQSGEDEKCNSQTTDRDVVNYKGTTYGNYGEISSNKDASCNLKNTEDKTVDSSTLRLNSAQQAVDSVKNMSELDGETPDIIVGRWFDINDECIAEVDPATFSRVFEGPECAYMLFYRNMGLPVLVNSTSK
ncbi:ubiquitin carboxyl-terminal hydrolase 40 [Paragonimus westermani]|uniref:Ubiquitin carboxyl-terminal hydrolase 40 n=1 Tax=Paragonimus westermani TaxID=34504 RepID=A0A5J4NDC7_9TREM|nr:ubiquitin carboxyl-terminal hydrolase 40 [Paragonimus westermani]